LIIILLNINQREYFLTNFAYFINVIRYHVVCLRLN